MARIATTESTMRSLRERQRAERAELILQAAQEVFADKGYYDASIDEIAARAGIAKGTVYLHFTSKEDLLAALVEQQLLLFLAKLDQICNEAGSVRVRLELVMLHVFSGLYEAGNPLLLGPNNNIGLTKSVVEKHVGLQAHTNQAIERIAGLFEEGKLNGELNAAVPTSVMAATFIALLSSRGYEQLLMARQISPTELVASVSRILFPGILASTPKES